MRYIIVAGIAGAFAIAAVFIAGSHRQTRLEREQYQQVAPTSVSYEIIKVDGCQYITIGGLYGFGHKGNCNNPEHKR